MPLEIKSPVTGTVWKVQVEAGATIEPADEALLLESMKMEVPVSVGSRCVVREIRVSEGDPVEKGQVLLVVDP